MKAIQKDSNAKYYNAETAKKTDYDKAVEEAKKSIRERKCNSKKK